MFLRIIAAALRLRLSKRETAMRVTPRGAVSKRSIQAAVRKPPAHNLRRRGFPAGIRQRRGLEMAFVSTWRRLVLGTNHISSFGVWRLGSRRMQARCNRTGSTRWHRPRRPSPWDGLVSNRSDYFG